MTTLRQIVALGGAALLACTLGSAAASAQTAVPDQEWYPDGYLDLRNAAAQQVETFPREILSYDLVDCALGEDLPDDLSEEDRQLALVALDIARMRSELGELGYPLEVYDQPLLDYEHWNVDEFVPDWAEHLIALLEDTEPEVDEYGFVEGESFADYELRQYGMLGALKQELEARRQRLSPRKPAFYVEGGCGAGEAEFEIKLVPDSGELWLINAFAFRVCERKVADPWDHGACGWTQYVEGDSAFASGRYMYEARWGGTVKRGARVLQGDLEENEGGVITFSR